MQFAQIRWPFEIALSSFCHRLLFCDRGVEPPDYSTGLSQTQVRHIPSAQEAATTELDKRLAAARAARDSGEPSVAQLANERLIAVALAELARLRMAEEAFPQAVELYRSSLFERCPSHASSILERLRFKQGNFADAISRPN